MMIGRTQNLPSASLYASKFNSVEKSRRVVTLETSRCRVNDMSAEHTVASNVTKHRGAIQRGNGYNVTVIQVAVNIAVLTVNSTFQVFVTRDLCDVIAR